MQTSTVKNQDQNTVNKGSIDPIGGQKIFRQDWGKDDPRQTYVQYAYELGGIDLVLLNECENSNRDMYRKA
ncbi:MAG: hypothetical protein LBU27_00355 [Candidatus Peribacteria bacterium]|nr:hypothetical protein [Candidatus Peribacteria bacterium]